MTTNASPAGEVSVLILFLTELRQRLLMTSLTINNHSKLEQCNLHALYKKIKFPIKDFFSKCDHIRSFLRIWSGLLKKSLIKISIFCTVMTLLSSSQHRTHGYFPLTFNILNQSVISWIKVTIPSLYLMALFNSLKVATVLS